MKRITKYIAFLPFLFLLLPVAENLIQFDRTPELKGAYVPSEKPVFTTDSWLSSDYQNKEEKYLNDHVGFHDLMVRWNNQIDYTVFGQINTNHMIKGKEDHFLDDRYLTAYLGLDFIFPEILQEKLRKFKLLQDTLSAEGKNLILVFEPGKVRTFPEFIEDDVQQNPGRETNLDVLIQTADELGINYLDLNNFFLKIKDTVSWPLYPEISVHWSTYGMTLAFDTIIKFTSQQSAKEMTSIQIKDVEITDQYKFYSEYDIEDALNLVEDLPRSLLAYPVIEYDTIGNIYMPNALAVADSYFFNIMKSDIQKNIFNNLEFWYYYKTRFIGWDSGTALPDSMDLLKELDRFDLIYLMTTELTLNDFGWGFIEALYDIYFPDDRESKYQYYLRQVFRIESWLEKAKKEAEVKNLSLKESVEGQANYMFRTDFDKNRSDNLNDYYYNMELVMSYENSWSKKIRSKAVEMNISVEEATRIEARLLYAKDHSDQ